MSDVTSPTAGDYLQYRALEDVFENGGVGLHLIADDGTILRANRSHVGMLGYELADYVGRKVNEFASDVGVIDGILDGLGHGERIDRAPARLKHRDGSARDVLISCSGLFQSGERLSSLWLVVDVTDTIELHSALAEQQARLALAAETAQVGVWDWDLATNEMVYSEIAKAICGFSEHQPVTFDMVVEATHPDDLVWTLPMSARARDPGIRERRPYEYRIVRPNGEVRWVLAHGQAIFDGEGPQARALRYVGAIQDVTERHDLTEALRRSQARLTVAMEAARMAVWDSERSSEIDASQELLRLMGLQDRTGVTLDDLRERYLPGEQERVQEAAQAAVMAGERTFETEYRFLKADGSMGWLLVRAEIEPLIEGQPPKAVGVLIDISERKAVEAALQESEERLRALADNLPNGMIYQMVSTEDGRRKFTFVSNSCERLNGVAAADVLADAHRLYGLIHPDDLPALAAAEKRAIETRTSFDDEIRMRQPDGSFRWQRISAAPRELPDGATLWDGIQIDVDPRRRAEEQLQSLNAVLEERVQQEIAERTKAEAALRQAQKMEALGQLTGGVAHDFNNLLTVIIGGLDTIRRLSGPGDSRVRRATDMALHASQRAASLTGGLLAFSRKQALDPRPADLNALMRSMTDLLHRTLGEEVELEGVLAARLWRVEVDPNQLESAILNLALNARDAMPNGGKLTIETANVALDENYAGTDVEVVPGQYVMISVSDTGHGMDSDTLSRVFEPFFSTKEVGKGTGLGLSMVYGFAKQSGGHVTIYSEPGEGTTVKLYFPRYQGVAEAAAAPKLQPPLPSDGAEVVLVVEDSDDVREYTVSMLEELGYRVLQAVDGVAARDILASGQRLDLLLTDVVLPGMSGREVADLAAELRPGLKVLFTTGYSRNAIIHQGRLDPGVNLLSKPFTFEALGARVRAVLDGQFHPPSA